MKLFLRLIVLFVLMFGMNTHVLAVKKCSRTIKTLQALPGLQYENGDDFQSHQVKSVCTNTNPVIMDQHDNEQAVSTRSGKKIFLYLFYRPEYNSNPPFAPPRPA
ncbi:MAG TPA: hypothetical protein VGC29_02115 [Flavisolibacter sp.]